ncbi:hypothetical protein D0867_02220 [Hortaea werneckii]|uniref:Zn(2)-C6 fungal-type domain-containing protein n=1 Tax=Hortaea werneckii TaxID=91943 RepID=A0A3M7BPB3_HORWE|nr:hypothetical protein D0867_02220 [Hortaea werneckii]RMY41643.1 hypothetical protein D0866_00457 [Hortaea werneckii]
MPPSLQRSYFVSKKALHVRLMDGDAGHQYSRIRRVKCDEAKPHCHRCTSTGRKCDGYSTQEAHQAEQPPNSLSLGPSISVDPCATGLEKRTFDFFRTRTAPCISGYFPDPVWDRYVLQTSQHEPTIRYAVNALGALHEERLLRRTVNETCSDVPAISNGFPVLQYSKALHGLQSLLHAKTVPMDLVLMAVLLMVHFESLRESFVPALVHVEHAIRLLHSSTTFDARKVDPNLVRSIMRLDVQGSLYLGMRIPGLPFYTAATDNIFPTSLHDLAQARDLVNVWTCRLFHFMRAEADEHKFKDVGGVPLEKLAKSHELTQTFVDLDALLWDFMHRPTLKPTVREQLGLGMLRTRVKINKILAATCLYSEATMFDAFLPDFEDVLSICSYILASDAADRRLLTVSLDEGLLQPLFTVATHCRESRIRHSALVQLRKLASTEGSPRGIWHVEAMVRTAEVCIRFEEACCERANPSCSDIPEWCRVHSSGFDGWDVQPPKRQRVFAHMRLRPNGMDGEWADFSEAIEWSVSSHSMLGGAERQLLMEHDQLGQRNPYRYRQTVSARHGWALGPQTQIFNVA